MRQVFFSKNLKNFTFFLLIGCLIPPSVISAQTPVCNVANMHQKVWAFELTESGQGISFINRSKSANTITVNVYNPDGTLNMMRTVALAGYQTVTQYPSLAAGSGGWDLPVTNDDDPNTDVAYAMVASSSEAFSVMVYPDEMHSGFGTGKEAIWAQNTVTNTWFGMYNYPAIANNGNAREYFFITNPTNSTAMVSVNLYKSDGTALGTNPRTITVGATRSAKIYLEDDLNSSPNSPAPPSSDVAGVNQNIGINLTSSVGVNVQVYTSLGTDWNESSDFWQAHNGSAGVYVGYGAECNRTKYGWIDQKNGAQQTAARVTNPNNFPITIRQTFYPDDNTPSSYVLETTIPAHGTTELPNAEGTWKDEAIGQTHGKARHYRTLESIDNDGAGAVQIGGFHSHVTYDQQIDYPAPFLTNYWWGARSSAATDELFIINPHDTAIAVHIEYSVDGSGILTPAHAAGSPIIIPPKEALEFQVSTDFISPNTEPPLPSADRSKQDITYHYYSNAPFFLHLELTFPGPYGDLMPWDCGCGAMTEDWGDLPDTTSAIGSGNYPTLVEHNGPSHTISNQIRLGAQVDADVDGNPSVIANADNQNAFNDEDGVDLNDLKLKCGQTASVDLTVFNNSGSPTYLYGWIDLDGDGQLENSERQTLTIPTNGAAQSVTLNFGTVPCSGLDTTFARFRLGTDNTKSSVPTGWGGNGEVEDYLVTICTEPTLMSVAHDTATCTNGTANANAAVAVRGIAGMARYAYSTNGTIGLFAANATTSTADSIRLSNLPNPSVATTYTVRIWAADTACYNDTTVILPPSVCPTCSVVATFTQSVCNNNGTTAITTDDYFTVALSAVSAMNGGTSGKYEVVLMPAGTVLNTGGTNYGTSVTVGGAGVFSANGTATYMLKVRDLSIPTCETAIFTTTPRSECSTAPCPPQICVPVTITRN